jgi:tetrapyrrole methylase family protein/MazG family protein
VATNEAWNELVAVMARLRGPGGCPWDREQTHASLKKYIVEEAYEVLEAIDGGDPSALAEELGDLLLQIVFQARIAEEAGGFAADDVVRAITAKLIRRHPHVFGEGEAATADEVLHNWELIKKTEGKGRKSLFDGIPRSLPALLRAARVQSRAASVGFDWRQAAEVMPKLREEVAEIDQALAAGDPGGAADELGDLIFAVVNLARHLKVDAEDCLNRTNERFMARFAHVERRLAEDGRIASDATLEELDSLWEEAKRREGARKG